MRARPGIIPAVFVCVAIIAASAWYVWVWEFGPPYLEADFLSLNKGHGIFIRLPDKETVLIDGGQSGDIIRNLSRLLPFYRRSISAIFMTRPEAKYVGGLVDVLNRYWVGRIYVPSGMGTSTAEEAVLSLAKEKDVPIQELSAGDQVELEKEMGQGRAGQGPQDKSAPDLSPVLVNVLFPANSFKYSNASPQQFVLDLNYGRVNILFTDDASAAIQSFLAKTMATSSVDILEYANSGGAGNVSQKFIEKLAPKHIVIKSSGKSSSSPKSAPKKPQFTVHSYVSAVEDVASSSATFFSDGITIWPEK